MMSDLPIAIQNAPIVYIKVNDGLSVVDRNLAAKSLGIENQQIVTGFFRDEEGTAFRNACKEGEPFELNVEFRNESLEKPFLVQASHEDSHWHLWLIDHSEQVALASQVRLLKKPLNKVLKQVQHYAVTGLGYSELLTVILDDESNLSADKLTAVKQYQAEITNNLKHLQQLAAAEKSNVVSLSPGRRTVLVVEKHKDLTEVISELLLSQGYKVVSFSDQEKAIRYCEINGEKVNTAVVDGDLRDADGIPLPEKLVQMNPSVEMIRLVSGENEMEAGTVSKPINFDELLTAIENSATAE